jgi:hypothetical protein
MNLHKDELAAKLDDPVTQQAATDNTVSASALAAVAQAPTSRELMLKAKSSHWCFP